MFIARGSILLQPVNDGPVLIGKVRWSIVHTSLSREEKEYKLSKAKERQWRAYSLPPGVSVEGMEEIWNQLDFGGKQRRLEGISAVSSGSGSPASVEKESTFDPSSFSPPSKNVRLLRELSMRGKVEMELNSEREKGRPKLIWGEPQAYIEQVESDGEVVVEVDEMSGEPLVKWEERGGPSRRRH